MPAVPKRKVVKCRNENGLARYTAHTPAKAEPPTACHCVWCGRHVADPALGAVFCTRAKTTATSTKSSASSEKAYQAQLEEQLTTLIEQISGAGKTIVMVTLESGEETIYATDTQSGQTQSQETHILLDDGSALAETTYLPTVCGVAVVCDGGGDVRVAARITELVRALLDLPANHICVEQRKR